MSPKDEADAASPEDTTTPPGSLGEPGQFPGPRRKGGREPTRGGDHAIREPPGVVGPGRLRVRPGPRRHAYSALAQHALREAKVLARNIHAVLDGKSPEPFVYQTAGLMGSLGHNKGLAQVLKVRLRGFTAW